MLPKLALIKLAAIGDVAMACRALDDLAAAFTLRFELHWMIDPSLAGLARALLRRSRHLNGLPTRFHAIDSAALFRGSTFRKALGAVRLARAIRAARPDYVVLLHRDWRYLLAIRAAYFGTVARISSERRHEIDVYRLALERAACALDLPRLSQRPAPTRVRFGPDRPTRAIRRIGLLVGGARSPKLLFREKRWPRITELARLLSESSKTELVFFGGAEDRADAVELSRHLDARAHVTDLTGKLSLEELPDALAQLDSLIAIDSGLAHVASLVMTEPGQRIVSLFGPTDPALWAPMPSELGEVRVHYVGAACSPCYANDGRFSPCRFSGERFQHCMTAIDPGSVVTSAARR